MQGRCGTAFQNGRRKFRSDGVRVLIVDDEPLARRGVCVRLRKFPGIQIVGECGDGASALENILKLEPDLVFLDVQMPDMDGFDVLRTLPAERVPAVIFLTAHEQHALRAFEVHALDYLLKPLDDERFATAVNRAQLQMDAASKAALVGRILGLLDQQSRQYVSRFMVRMGSRIQVVPVEDVEWISAAGDYTELHARSATHLLRETMNSLEQRLDPNRFVRVHRSRIINLARILELRPIDNREYLVKLSDGSQHRSSRTYADRLEHWLHSGKDEK
jgi:two-component system, LytTR family, response regulator